MVWKTSGYRKFGSSLPSTRTLPSKVHRWMIGTATTNPLNLAVIAAPQQNTIATLDESAFAGTANIRVPGLAKLGLTMVHLPSTVANFTTDVWVLQLPTAVTTPTLTGALNWAALLKGVKVLGYKRFVTGVTTIPRIVKIPVRSFPTLGLEEQLRIVTVVRPINAVAFSGVLEFRVVPVFRV